MKKIVLAVLSFLLVSSYASAAVTEIKIEKDFSNNLITVSGKASPKESVTFQILPDGISLSSFAASSTKEDDIAFVYEEQADENGDFSVTAVLKGDDNQIVKYDVFLASEDVTKPAELKDDVPFSNSTYYGTQLTALNGAIANQTAFVNTAKANLEVFGYDDPINSIINIDDTLNFMYNDLKNNGTTLDSGKYVENMWLFKNSAIAVALNNNKISLAYDYVENIINKDNTLKKYWEQYITGDIQEQYLFNKISGKNIADNNDLKTKLIEGLILTATKYPNGYMSLQGLYSDYKNFLGLSTVSSANSVYSSIGTKDYASIKDLKDAYNAAISTNPNNNNGGGGASLSISTDGGQKVTTGGSFGAVISGTPNSSYVQSPSLNLGFKDLSAFEWAYSSISILHELGIVSGLSDIQFAPGKQVKREEFIKMIVCAMDLKTNTGNEFADVDNNAWYAPYVYAAYNSNLVNGISKNEFGIAKDISRQDMAVMIYNAIKAKGYIPLGAELAFDDKNNISDYAKEAVSELVSVGIINGMGDGRFAPMEKATRAQASVIVERALKYLKQ